jgi:hypothetical protein
MIRATLQRLETGDQGTFGRFSLPDGRAWFSGELPDRGNAPNVSCIPAGLYRVLWTWSPAFRRMMYLVAAVPGRSGVRIHAANYMGDRAKGHRCHLNGCIALGQRLGHIENQKALILSGPAITAMESALDRKSFELEILPCGT